MSIRLDPELRATLTRLSETPPPGDLAERIVRGARHRYKRFVVARAIVAVTAVLIVVPVAVAAVSARTGAGAQPGGPAPRVAVTSLSRLMTGPDGTLLARLADAGIDYHSLVLDPTTGTYRELEYNVAALSPDGRTVLVADGNNGASPYRAGLLDLGTDSVRWLALDIDGVRLNPYSASWAPDGTRILLEDDGSKGGGGAGFAIVDASTLEATRISVREPAAEDVTREGLAWMPDGEGVVGTLYRTSVGVTDASTPVGLRVFDLAGNVVREIAVSGWINGNRDFAPDGRRVAVSTGEGFGSTNLLRLVDVSSGAVVTDVPLATRSVLVGWYDDDHVIVQRAVDGPDAELAAVVGRHVVLDVVDLAGRVVRTVDLPERATNTTSVEIGNAAIVPDVVSAVVF